MAQIASRSDEVVAAAAFASAEASAQAASTAEEATATGASAAGRDGADAAEVASAANETVAKGRVPGGRGRDAEGARGSRGRCRAETATKYLALLIKNRPQDRP